MDQEFFTKKVNMKSLQNELDTEYCFAYDLCDTKTPEGMEKYRLRLLNYVQN